MLKEKHSSPAVKPWHSCLPEAALPYIQLMRLDRPNGYWYFWFPHAFGTLWTAIQQRSPPQSLARANLVLLWGVLVMRGATCTWNDTADVKFDRQVSRCRNRPLARGAVSVAQAHVFTAAQTLVSVATLALLLPSLCAVYAVPAVVGCRPMAWGVYMGAASMGADPLRLAPLLHALTATAAAAVDPRYTAAATMPWWQPILVSLAEIRVDWPLTVFFMANVIWTLLYELVYSHQDAAEDAAAGVKNLVLLYAVRLEMKAGGPDPRAPLPTRFGTMPLLYRLATAQTLLLVAAGSMAGFGLGYNAAALTGTAAALATMLSRVRLDEPESCAWWFKVGNIWFAGGAMVMGLAAEYVGRLLLE
ncbi:para-hydroxybenzoate-polyprenyltransferase [Apiospora kogelbergensis]|uniref:Para-hydroxybenzoate-polyprenyltransferase n=1 Tax=Apiospora kogelbergensis TaxID=1337665 RepID=A0AAW0RE46_9PEZI